MVDKSLNFSFVGLISNLASLDQMYLPDGFHNQDNLNGHQTSLLRRLQAQTLPDATSPKVKIHPFSKIAVTFEPLMQF